jgi:alpha-tubulin suppressor-like RCC1 family protein
MKKCRIIKVLVICTLVLNCMLLSCVSFSGGTETGDARVSGVLYNSGGSLAKHATVKVFRWKSSPLDNDVMYATAMTDINGVYGFDSLPSDTYNILGSGDSGLSYLDSIVVNANDSHTQLPPDTLKPAGSIHGKITLETGDDPRTVQILFMGTDTWVRPDDSSGSFTVSNLAEGSYRIRIIDTLNNYQPKDTVLAVTAGKENPLPNPLSLVSTRIISIAAASTHSFFLKADSTLWACGWNHSGQLGVEQTDSTFAYIISTPVQVMAHVQSMDVGVSDEGQYAHSLILKTDNTLWACGYNGDGQFGNGTTNFRTTPVQVMADVKSMAVGELSHSLILKTDATLWACGNNMLGQLGDGTTNSHSIPVQVMNDVKSIDAGYLYSLILKADNTLWACGYNGDGRRGDGTTFTRSPPVQVMTDVKSMAMGFSHSLILKNDNTLWACGNNNSGQLGDGTTNSHSIPVQVMTDVKSMAAGGSHSLILKIDNTLLACGNNSSGQLGDGTTTSSVAPKIIILP